MTRHDDITLRAAQDIDSNPEWNTHGVQERIRCAIDEATAPLLETQRKFGTLQHQLMSRIEELEARLAARGDAEPVAWRWRPRGATNWIYNPSLEWLDAQGDDIEKQPLYASPPAKPQGERGQPRHYIASEPNQKLWLWKNGDHFLAYTHEYPCIEPGGDPLTLGQPVGYAIFKVSYDRQRNDHQSESDRGSAQLQRSDLRRSEGDVARALRPTGLVAASADQACNPPLEAPIGASSPQTVSAQGERVLLARIPNSRWREQQSGARFPGVEYRHATLDSEEA